MGTIARVLERAVSIASPGHGELNVPRALQSWPGIVHGGAVVALLDATAARLGVPDGPRGLEGRLTSSLSPETDHGLEFEPWEDGLTLTVFQGGQILSSGTIRPLRAGDGPASRWAGGREGAALPMSDDCLACGARNPLGLRVPLRFDDEGVWARLTPGSHWRASDARLHTAVAPVLLDEVAWWVGALVAKEGGLTNRINVTLLVPDLPFDVPLIAAGRFADVQPIDKRRTFWRTECALMTASGELLATASIVFRGGLDYSRRQMAYFRLRTPPGVFQRMFPNHTD